MTELIVLAVSLSGVLQFDCLTMHQFYVTIHSFKVLQVKVVKLLQETYDFKQVASEVYPPTFATDLRGPAYFKISAHFEDQGACSSCLQYSCCRLRTRCWILRHKTESRQLHQNNASVFMMRLAPEQQTSLYK